MKNMTLTALLFSLLIVSCGEANETHQSESENPDSSKSESVDEVSEEKTTTPEFKTVGVDDFFELIQQPCTILDVRTIAETDKGVIENAVLMDISKPNFHENIRNLDKSKPVCVYCKSGGRSESASRMLQDLGYTVYNLDGGMDAWLVAGKKVAKK